LRPVPAPIPSHPEARRGALAATGCYLLWGIVPLYWRQLASIDAVELIAHRHVWSLLVLLLAVSLQGGFGAIATVLRSPRGVVLHLLSAALLTVNWLVYVHAVNTGRVIECSLGYFLVPLVNVLVGRFVLHERMRGLQWAAIACAALGVGLLVGTFGEVPLVALALAASWGAYSLMRKRSVLPALPALSVETMLLLPLAVGWLLYCEQQGRGALGRVDMGMHLLLLSAGVVTAVPLFLFAYGAQRIRLSTLGLLQYVSPSVQLLLGVVVYDEPFPVARAISFAWIWAGLALYSVDGLLQARRRGG
jgi:chloramphenicol-sensitive protein RarD